MIVDARKEGLIILETATRIFPHNHVQGLQRMFQREKISSERQVSDTRRLFDVRRQRRNPKLRRTKGNSNSDNNLLLSEASLNT